MKAKAAAIVVLVMILASAMMVYACDYYATCPMHGINSTGTGRTRYTDGGQHMWAEYSCPGNHQLGEEPHTFWVQCN
jgi:hypothetical protein